MNEINRAIKKDWVIIILIILGFAIGAYFYPSIPDRVPTHWNFKGQVDGYGTKFTGTFGLAFLNLGLYLMFLVLPIIDPRKKNYERFKTTYQFFKYIMVVFFLVFETVTLLIAKGMDININVVVQMMISLLFILMGNVMGRVKHNYFVGIKTPWTLANEEVWRKTHRMAGPLWVIGGVLNLLITLLGFAGKWVGFIIIVGVISIVPMVYSFIVSKNIENSVKQK